MDHELLLRLVKQQGSLEQVSRFLKERGLHHSGRSWQEMIDLRLRPAISKKQLDDDDLINLLRQTEEYGAQHIFFYRLVANRNISKLFGNDLPSILKEAGFPAIGHTSLVDMPAMPKIVEVRIEERATRSVYFKIVEKRTNLERVSDEAQNGQLIVKYNQVPYRAVNLMRIQESGVAEIRIQSYSDAVSYGGHAEGILKILHPVVDRLDWKDEKLDALKANLLDVKQRSHLRTIFGLRHTQHANTEGTRLSAAVGNPGASMYDDDEAVASIDRFTQKENHAHCERVNVTMKKHGTLERSIGIMVSGEANEIAITSKVSRKEYEYITDKILEHNK